METLVHPGSSRRQDRNVTTEVTGPGRSPGAQAPCGQRVRAQSGATAPDVAAGLADADAAAFWATPCHGSVHTRPPSVPAGTSKGHLQEAARRAFNVTSQGTCPAWHYKQMHLRLVLGDSAPRPVPCLWDGLACLRLWVCAGLPSDSCSGALRGTEQCYLPTNLIRQHFDKSKIV